MDNNNNNLAKGSPLSRQVRFHVNSKDQYMHFNSEFEILYVLSGRVIVSSQSQSHTLKAEDIIVFNRYQLHSVAYMEGACSITLSYTPSFFEKTDIGTINCNSITQPDMHEVFDEIRAKLANLYQIYLAGYDRYDLYLLSQSYELLGILRQYFSRDGDFHTGKPEMNWLADVFQYIGEHYTNDISLKALGERFHLSEGHLSRVLKHYLGMSYTEYVRKLRMDKAKNLLKRTALPVTDISMECGFNYVNTFITAFKKEAGVTPTQFRNQVKTEQKTVAADQNINLTAIKLSRHLRESDYEKFKVKREKSTPIEVNADMRSGRSWSHNCHCQTIKISHAKLLLFEEVRDALRHAKRDIDYEYIHIHGILDDAMNFCRVKPGGGYALNYVYIDLAIDFILSIEMKPWIEIGYTPNCCVRNPKHFLSDSCLELPDSLEEWGEIVQDVLQHFIQKYGRKRVQQWRFAPVYELYSYYQIYSLEAYLNYYESMYRIIRKILPKTTITGWGFQLETITEDASSDFRKTLSFCADRNILPDLYDFQFFHIDFSKVDETQMGQAIRTQHKALAVVHRDSELLSTKMSIVKKLLIEHGIQTKRCVIGSWNCGLWQRELSNDTCFKSAFIIKNVLENTDDLLEVAYCNLTDLTEQTLTTPTVFHGGNGLVTYQNIKKAAYYSFVFLNHLNDILVSKDKSYCITRSKDGRHIDVLLYHYCHYVQSLTAANLLDMIPESIDRYGVYGYHIPISIHLNLQRMMPGKYTIERYVVSREHGSSYDTWVEMGSPEEMDERQRNYLSRQAIPWYVCQRAYVDQNGNLEISASLQMYEIQYIRIKFFD